MSQISQFSDIYSSSIYDGDPHTLESALNPDFLTPITPPLIPASLQRVGPSRSLAYILYSEMSKDDFEQFNQVANAKTGKLGVKCRQCQKVLNHPASGRYGTIALNRHLASLTCRKSTSQKANIKGLLINISSVTLLPLPDLPLHNPISLQQKQYDLGYKDRVLIVTTDNVSNNNTLMLSIQELLQSLKLNNGSTIVRVPCIAYVIQLSLNDLLRKLKSDERFRSLRARQQRREIINILNKVRNLAIYINITQPFFKFTTLLSKTKDVSIHLVFSIYNKLFNHLEKSISALRRKKLILSSLEAAKRKLSTYYSITDTIDGNLYTIGTILSPQQLKIECGAEESQPLASTEFDELKEYLDSALTNLARDVLSIPATGAGVKRLFNSARGVYHYRRGSLKPSTIQDLMMFMCTSKFEIEEGQRALINEYLLHKE
ncbi:uncharacterized protein N7477_001554, partial [Penicillium maclennaniae]|uniref:uncharacterized protein n=1 Tax=Penicillium maclennaniae TaxID=1343394 RepID=UPI00253F91A0